MENKIYTHVSRHRVGYLIAAVLVIVGGFTFSPKSVPNFSALDNSALTGNVGELSNVSNQVTLLDSNLSSSVVMTGEKMTIDWKSNNNTADLYLLSEDKKTAKPVTIRKSVISSGDVKSYVWEVPASVASGSYSLGLQSGGKMDKTDMSFTIIQVGNKADGGLSALQSQLKAVSAEMDSNQTQLATVKSQIKSKNEALVTLKKNSQAASLNLNKNIASFQAQKNNLSATAYKTQAEGVYALNGTVTQTNLAVTVAQAELVNLEAKAKTLEAKLADKQVQAAALQGKITEVQGVNNMNLNSSVMAGADNKAVTSPSFVTLNAEGIAKMTETELKVTMEAHQNKMTELKLQAETTLNEQKAAELEVTNSQKAFDEATTNERSLSVSLEKANAKVTEVSNKLTTTQDRVTVTNLQNELKVAQTEAAGLKEQLSLAQITTQTAMQKLSSGLRVKAATDDAATKVSVSISALEVELSALNAQLNTLQMGVSVSSQNQASSNQMKVTTSVSNDSAVTNSISSGVTSGASVTEGLSVTNGSAEASNAVSSGVTLSNGVTETARTTNDVTKTVTAQ